MKTLKVILPALVAVTIFLSSCGRDADESTGASYTPPEGEIRAIAAEALTVGRGLLIPTVRGAGIAYGTKEAWVISQTEGLITEVSFELGEEVGEGQLLLRVDDEFAARNRDLARQRLQTAQLEYDAALRSRENGSISELQFSQTRDRLLSAQAALVQAQEAYDATRLIAPFNGAVAVRDRSYGQGNYLTRSARVAQIVDDSRFQTEINVGEGQVLLIEEGAEAEILGNDGLIRRGSVKAISAGSDRSTGSFAVLVEWIPGADDPLRSGMSVDVSIAASRSEDRVIVPASAVLTRSGDHFVFIDDDGVARRLSIELGSRLGDQQEVLSGLDEGQVLLTSALSSLTDGVPVSSTLLGISGGLQ